MLRRLFVLRRLGRIGISGRIDTFLRVGDVERGSDSNGKAEASKKSKFMAHGYIPLDVETKNR